MDKFKEFQGKDLDECIKQAMDWFDCPRETLEVDILQDAKSGIFGIVGARKAKIRARRAHVVETVRNILDNVTAPSQDAEDAIHRQEAGENQQPPKSRKPERNSRESRARKSAQSGREPVEIPPAPAQIVDEIGEDEDLVAVPVESLDKQKLEELAREVVGTLIGPIAGRDVGMTVDLEHGNPRVRIEWEGDAGLLIGREGQTLVALQYLASRVLSRKMGSALRVQLDIGEYRTRQDDRLRELARTLADKVRKTGRPCSTKPLSSYHRRVVHLCLQQAEDIQTRSTGEGAMKRVLISPRRS